MLDQLSEEDDPLVYVPYSKVLNTFMSPFMSRDRLMAMALEILNLQVAKAWAATKQIYRFASGLWEILTGRRFGLLTVVKKLPPRKDAPNRSVWYQCLCDCGNVCEMSAQTLTLHQSRYPRNCGCIKTLPLEERRKLLLGSSGIEARQKYQRGINVGEIYNSYEVIEILEDREYPSGQKQKQCKVRCLICGEEKIMSTSRAKYEICKHRGRLK